MIIYLPSPVTEAGANTSRPHSPEEEKTTNGEEGELLKPHDLIAFAP